MAEYSWSPEEDAKLRSLVVAGGLFYTEIAERLGRKPCSVRRRAKKLGLPSSKTFVSGRMGKWNAKTVHLREDVMTFFLTHTWDETRDHFGLTDRSLKSLFGVSYKQPEFKHLRKDRRPHTPWDVADLVFMLRHSGLRPRKWIVSRLPQRGSSVYLVKDRLSALGIASRNLQGLTLSQFRMAFGRDPRFFLQTDAGPDGGLKTSMPTRWKIVPWVWMAEEIRARRLKTATEMRLLIETRAMFQEWIFGGNALRKMKRICKEAEVQSG